MPMHNPATNVVIIQFDPHYHLEKLIPVYIDAYSNFDSNEKWDSDTTRAYLTYNHDLQPDLSLVALIDGKVVGAFFASVKPWWDGARLIDGEIFVDPTYQNKGIGKKLIRQMFLNAKEKHGVYCWDTFTFKQNHQLDFYKNMGFEEISDWTMITGDIDTVLSNLEKTLKL